MPFTLAHPAMAVPLLRPLRNYGALSALIIGSMVPDIAYFVPFTIGRTYSHSWWGLLWFCIPLGLLCYALFHWFLKGPLLSLLPSTVGARLVEFAPKPQQPLLAVMASLFCGAATHLFWDSFTHGDTPLLVSSPILRIQLFWLGNFPVELHFFLQLFSSFLGLILLAWWAKGWLANKPIPSQGHPFGLPNPIRLGVISSLMLIPTFTGSYYGLQAVGGHTGIYGLLAFIAAWVVISLPMFTSGLALYALAWHLQLKKRYVVTETE